MSFKKENGSSVLITGCNSPSITSTIPAISKCNTIISNIVGIDTNPNPVLFKKVISSCQVNSTFIKTNKTALLTEEEFILFISDIVVSKKINLIIPQITCDLLILSKYKDYFETNYGCEVLVNNYDTINVCNDKYLFIEKLKEFKIATPITKLAITYKELLEFSNKVGYADKNKFIIKPRVSSGSRGFRIIEKKQDLKLTELLNNKPDLSNKLTLMELVTVLSEGQYYFTQEIPNKLPTDLLCMEYLPGTEYTVDCFAIKGSPVIVFPRTRDSVINGISHTTTSIKHEHIISVCNQIIDSLKLDSVFGFQFKENKDGIPLPIECNPRTQAGMILGVNCEANVIGTAIDYILDSKFSLDSCAPENIVFGKTLYRTLDGILCQ